MPSDFNPFKTQFLFNDLCSGHQDLLTPILNTFESRGLSEAEKILLRIVEGDSDLDLSENEVEEGQQEQDGESSEENTAAVEEPEPEQGQSDDTHRQLWIRAMCKLGF